MFASQEQFIVACRAFHKAIISAGEADGSSSYWCWIEDFAEWTKHEGISFPITNETLFSIAVEKWIDAGPNSPFSFEERSDALYEDRTGKDLRYSRMTVRRCACARWSDVLRASKTTPWSNISAEFT